MLASQFRLDLASFFFGTILGQGPNISHNFEAIYPGENQMNLNITLTINIIENSMGDNVAEENSHKRVTCRDNTGSEGEYHLLDLGVWREVRPIQGDKKGEPYTVRENGVVPLSRELAGVELRVFAKDVEPGEYPKLRTKKITEVME